MLNHKKGETFEMSYFLLFFFYSEKNYALEIWNSVYRKGMYISLRQTVWKTSIPKCSYVVVGGIIARRRDRGPRVQFCWVHLASDSVTVLAYILHFVYHHTRMQFAVIHNNVPTEIDNSFKILSLIFRILFHPNNSCF